MAIVTCNWLTIKHPWPSKSDECLELKFPQTGDEIEDFQEQCPVNVVVCSTYMENNMHSNTKCIGLHQLLP